MSKLALPIRAFIEDFVKRAFPTRDWSRGSAANDLVIKAFAAMLQPLRHETDVIRVNQSLANWRYMRPEDLDALAANWGHQRQTGGVSVGTVRMYFDAAQDYQFNNLTFYSSDGTTFDLSSPVSISATALFQRRLSDGTFYFDVTVQSTGIGSRYSLPAGSIVGIQNRPPGVIRVENAEDFTTTAPDESNFDVVNALYKNVGLRNLVSRQSIRAPILDTFPGVVDVFIAGAGHPAMTRDLVNVVLPTGPAAIHTGGMTDVWVNTNALSRQQVSLSYVPDSHEIKLVSREQADATSTLFSFNRGLISIDGVFSNPDLADYEADESITVTFETDDVPISSFVQDQPNWNQLQLAVKDVVLGTDLVVMPSPNGYSPYLADFTGLDLSNTDVAVGDTLFGSFGPARISAKTGTVFDTTRAPFTVQYPTTSYDCIAGSTVIPVTSDFTASLKLNSTVSISVSAASGDYSLLEVTSTQFRVGRLEAAGTVTYTGVDPLYPGFVGYDFTAPGSGRPMLPRGIATGHYLYFGTDAGFDAAKLFAIAVVIPGTASTRIYVNDFSAASLLLGTTVRVIAGLNGAMPAGTSISVRAPIDTVYNQSSIIAAPSTRYVNVLEEALAVGDSTLTAIGISAFVTRGDIIAFDGQDVSFVVSATPALDRVVFQPPVPETIPAGSRFSIQTSQAITSLVPTARSVVDKTVTFASTPPGIGDGIGWVLRDPAGNVYVATNSTAGNIRKLTFVPPTSVRTVVLASGGYTPASAGDVGRPVAQVNGPNTYNGILYSYDNTSRTWRIIPNGPSDTFISTSNPITVTGSLTTGTPSSPASAPTLVGYTNAAPADIGKIVRQGSFMGILDSYDNGVYTWNVKPLGDLDTFSSLTQPVTIDSGTGTGTLAVVASPLLVGSGSVTFVLDTTPAFAPSDVIEFLSRRGVAGGAFDGETFTISDVFSPGSVFSTVIPDTHKLMVLAGDSVGVYDITRVDGKRLRVRNPPAPTYSVIANAPAAKAIVLSSPTALNTTTFTQPDVGRWAHRGRAICIALPSGDKLFAVRSVISVDSVELELPIPFVINPNAGYTWQVVEAFTQPYWIVNPASSLLPYRISRVPVIGDTVYSGATGRFTSASTLDDKFTDDRVDFNVLLANADFNFDAVRLFIDSGSEASSLSIPVRSVVSTNVLQLDTLFTTIETNISYRLVVTNPANAQEVWYEATVTSSGANPLELTLDVPGGFDFARAGSHQRVTPVIQLHPAWTIPVAWPIDVNWTMPIFAVNTYNTSTKVLTFNTVNYTPVAGSAWTGTSTLLTPGTKVRVSLMANDRIAASTLKGSVTNSFDYYTDAYFSLPVVKITDVQLLDSDTLQPIRSLAYTLRVDNKGLRYSASETNTLVIAEDVASLPIRVSYVADTVVPSISNYLNDDDTRVLNCNQIAKVMETFSVSVELSVRSTLQAPEIASYIASFINNKRSTQPLSKADIIKDLFDHTEISYIDIESFKLSGVYLRADGATLTYPNVSELFGSDTARYLSDNISITKI